MMPTVLAAVSLVVVYSLWTTTAGAVSTTLPQVVGSAPHDPEAFTQGLFLYEATFFESTGLLGQSTLRQVQPATGRVLRQIELDADEFGEGIARVGDSIWMLTWKNQVAHRFELHDFSLAQSVTYEGEGWGLCFDGTRLVMSDGSSSLQFRDPQSFALQGRIDVTRDGDAVTDLNELECALGYVYANVWHSDMVLQIEPDTGNVVSQIDCSELLTDDEAVGADVLNGIAYAEESGHFFLTGKYWPRVFEVALAAASLPEAGASSSQDGGVTTAGPSSPMTGSSPDATQRDAGCRMTGRSDGACFPFWIAMALSGPLLRTRGRRRVRS